MARIEYTGKVICSLAEYHAAAAVGSSGLRTLINQSPAHFLYERENPSHSTPSQNFGTAIHQAILEPKRFKEMAVVEPVFSGTGSRNAREEWNLQNHGKTILKQEHYDAIQGILNAISKHPRASKLVAAGHAEESLFWKDAETGVQCKARPDFVREGHIVVDVKSTIDASLHSFQKDFASYGYHIQAALYLDACSEVLKGNYDTFIIIAIEKEAPHALNCFQIDQYSLQEGRELYQSALKVLKKCQETGSYPGYPPELVPLALPSWAVRSSQ